jgi:signal transduction histidine kinase
MAQSSKQLSPKYSGPGGPKAEGSSGTASATAGTFADHSQETGDAPAPFSAALSGQLGAGGTAVPPTSEGDDTTSAKVDQTTYRQYTLDQRQRLTAVIAPWFAVLALFSFLVFSVFLATVGSQRSGLYGLDATFGLTAAALVGATLLVRRGKTNLAATITVISIAGAIVLVQLMWVLNRGIDPYGLVLFAALDVAIMLVGMLGTVRTTIATAAAISLFTVGLWIFAPRPPGMGGIVDKELMLVVPMSILAQWGVAILQIAMLRSSRQTLAQLGSVTMAYERARQLDELKDGFISSVNHELRTPLMAMLGYLEVLKLSINRASPEQMISLVEQANQAGLDLRLLVNSILETRRQDQGSSDFEPQAVNIRASLEAALRMVDSADMRPTPLGRGGVPETRDVHIASAPTLEVWGDQARLQQILVNLLSNAMKYSSPGTPIVVSAYPAPESVAATLRPLLVGSTVGPRRDARGGPRAVKIVVRDYGLGIPPEQASLLFQRFARLPRDLASNVIGNGLGLWLCQHLTQAMHGRIWVESTGVEGEGSEIHLLFPAPPRARENSRHLLRQG